MRLVVLCAVLFVTPSCSLAGGEAAESPASEDTTTDTGVDAAPADALADMTADAVPDTPADGDGPGPIPVDCELVPTLDSLQERYFTPSCTFSSCHDASNPAGGLDLSAGTTHDSLVEVTANKNGAETLIVPGDPDGSYLVKRLEGTLDNFMPSGATEPMDPECRIATLRAWILEGAQP
jgi:hypothetical protein